MSDKNFVILETRGVLKVEGPDARAFLQGLVSNDIEKVGPERAIYATFLTPQGKFLHDFFVVEHDDALYLDCEGARADDFKRRLSMFKLRSKVAVESAGDAYRVAALFGDGAAETAGLPAEPGRARALGGGAIYVDPRLAAAGLRALLPAEDAEETLRGAGFAPAEPAAYERLRLRLGLPDGSRDMEPEKATLLESNMDALNAIDWDKGCYMGQELTARTRYRGLVKRRLVPMAVEGPVPAPGTAVMADGKEAGTVRSGHDGLALASLKLDYLDKLAETPGAFTAGESRLTARKPDWAPF